MSAKAGHAKRSKKSVNHAIPTGLPTTIPDDIDNQDGSWGSAKQPRMPKITYAKAFELIAVKGMSFREAAAILDVKHPSLWEFCKANDIHHKDELVRYKKHRADIIDAKGKLLLDSLTTDSVNSMDPYKRIVGYGILYDKMRLERGQSTQNVAYQDIAGGIEEIDREIAALQGQISDEKSESEPDRLTEEIEALEAEIGDKEPQECHESSVTSNGDNDSPDGSLNDSDELRG